MAENEASKRAIGYERMALGWAKKAQEGHAGAAELAQTFATPAMAARMEHMQWHMRALGDQLEDVKKSMDNLRRKLLER
ncbi:hypothetical protein [Streptomyces malaysiensis]|uniref:Uncharacterized protein n=1 Tax=Streptomyces malaysiensis subsp. samsunensis TaxID=459658 RepID=A0A9X2M607_STRMQ|nr:hypothetical protein [Streptomyces samsunensis]MCQ8836401.1 hypothetical protein [Streptomyces samsunensis]